MTAPPEPTSPELLAAFEAGRWEAAMSTLVEHWRACRAPELEALIIEASALMEQVVAPFDAKGREWEERFAQRAALAHSSDLSLLLRQVPRSPKNRILARLRAILRFGPDPRIGALLLQMISSPPTTSTSNDGVWSLLFKTLPEHCDERAAPRLRALATKLGQQRGFDGRLAARIERVLPRLPAVAQLPAAERSAVEQLGELLTRLRAHPDKLAPEPSSGGTAEHPDTAPMEGGLDSVLAALEAARLGDALEGLVSRWAGEREPTLAASIERLAVLVDAATPALDSPRKRSFHEQWMRTSRAARAREVGVLLADLGQGSYAELDERFESIKTWTPDPRVFVTMRALARRNNFSNRKSLWVLLYDALLIHADPRGLPDLEHALDLLSSSARRSGKGRQLDRVVPLMRAQLEQPPPRPLSNAEFDTLQAIDAAIEVHSQRQAAAHERERELVEHIAAAPEDEGPRLVYSDYLQGRGRVGDRERGEFIALDLALARGEKVKGKRDKLFKSASAAILGPLAPLLGSSSHDRGVLTRAQVRTPAGVFDTSPEQVERMLADLRWICVERIDTIPNQQLDQLLARAPLTSLSVLENVGLKSLLGLAQREQPLALAKLRLMLKPEEYEQLIQLDTLAPMLPKLQHLVLSNYLGPDPMPPASFFTTALARQLHSLVSGASHGEIPRIDQWLERVISTEYPVATLELHGGWVEMRAHQVERGRFQLELEFRRLWRGHDSNALFEALAGLPRAAIVSVKISGAERYPDLAEGLERALEGLPRSQ